MRGGAGRNEGENKMKEGEGGEGEGVRREKRWGGREGDVRKGNDMRREGEE